MHNRKETPRFGLEFEVREAHLFRPGNIVAPIDNNGLKFILDHQDRLISLGDGNGYAAGQACTLPKDTRLKLTDHQHQHSRDLSLSQSVVADLALIQRKYREKFYPDKESLKKLYSIKIALSDNPNLDVEPALETAMQALRNLP